MTHASSKLDTRALTIITQAAERGEPCPSNPQLAEMFGFSSVSSGSRLVERLRKAGMILVESGQCSRVVTIVATGKRTAGDVGKAHWRTFRPPQPKKPRKPYARRPEPVGRPLAAFPTPVDRDPCPRCGTRLDLGCAHLSTTSTGLALVALTAAGA